MNTKKTEQQTDLTLLHRIQPRGGISFRDERYYKVGNGYGAILDIHDYPSSKVGWFWLSQIMIQRDTIVTVDCGTEDIAVAKNNINKSAQEQNSRYNESKNLTEAQDAASRFQELNDFYATLESMNEVVKLIRIRIYLAAPSQDELDKKVAGMVSSLDGYQFKCAIFLNENKTQWQSFFQSFSEQQADPLCRRYGQPLFGEALAAGYPFHFVNLTDRRGMYLGSVLDGTGTVLFDLFAKTEKRRSYDAIVFGSMGAGKSSLLKKLLLDRAIRGDYIRGFDVSGEFRPLILALGGKMISLDGSDGMLNPLEIMRTDVSEKTSFALHMSKMKTMYQFLAPDSNDYDRIEFENLLRELYLKTGIIRNGDDEMTGCTDRPANEYPTFSDFLALANQIKSEMLSSPDPVQAAAAKEKYPRLERIIMIISNLCNNFGSIFDGHTSIENFQKEQIVFFDIKTLARMKDSIFDAQIYSALNLFWALSLTVGTKMKNGVEDGSIDRDDVTNTVILIDESHKTFNARKIHAVRNLIAMKREGRKYFVSIVMASQSIRDYIPEGTDQAALAEMKPMFELAQYKFIMQQDAAARPLLKIAFGDTLTETELESISEFETGECILSIQSDRNISFRVDLTDEELELFHGGV